MQRQVQQEIQADLIVILKSEHQRLLIMIAKTRQSICDELLCDVVEVVVVWLLPLFDPAGAVVVVVVVVVVVTTVSLYLKKSFLKKNRN